LIDIHSHVLPGLDDGARSLDESLAMLAMAAEAGTTDIVATPHAHPDYPFDAARVAVALDQLRAANPTSVRIHSGCDFHLDFDLVADCMTHPRKYSINGGPYLLIELPEMLPLRSVPPVVENLRQAGLIPILTHPERYFCLRDQLDMVLTWRYEGCFVQITAQSLTGMFGSRAKRMCEQLLDKDAVDFVASDAHDREIRTTRLDQAFAAVADRWGQLTAERVLVRNPRAALAGEPLAEQASRTRPNWLKRLWPGRGRR
jgi:protein-tyrosine phosphatase